MVPSAPGECINPKTGTRDLGLNMTKDRAHLNDADEAWIAKYRAALNDNPIQPSRSMRVRAVLQSAQNVAISKISRILARWNGARRHHQRPVASSEAEPPSQPPSSIRNRDLSGPKADHLPSPVLTGKALDAERAEAWQENPVA